MAIEAKTSFLRLIEKKLSATVTVDMMAKILSMVSDVMEGFDMREISIEEESDDMIECFLQALDVQGRSRKTIQTVCVLKIAVIMKKYTAFVTEDIKHGKERTVSIL